MLPLAPTDAAPVRPSAPAAPIVLQITVPKLRGLAGVAVRAALGIADLTDLFAKARVGDVHNQDDHAAFRVHLEPGDEVGGHTRAGLVAVANIGGQLRVTLPASWGSFLKLHGLECIPGTDERGGPVVQVYADATPGAGPRIPLPIGKRQGAHIAVKVVDPG